MTTDVGTARHELKSQLRHVDVVLTTYATLLRDIGHIKDVHFDYAILDEAQAIKNPKAAVSRLAHQIKARHRVALTTREDGPLARCRPTLGAAKSREGNRGRRGDVFGTVRKRLGATRRA